MAETTPLEADGPLTIDVVSDVMCPWCFIGKRRLEKAIGEVPAIPVAVAWHPFQLDPTIPPEGRDRQAYLEEKFGGADGAREVYDRIRTVGEAEGIPFAFEMIERSPNTLDAHRLIRWAGVEGAQDEVVERLFRLYFLEGADLGEGETLVEAGAESGMDADVLRRLLESDNDRDAVEQEIATAQRIGVTGVPCFILDGRYAVMGAQPPEVLAEAISRAYAERGAPLPE